MGIAQTGSGPNLMPALQCFSTLAILTNKTCNKNPLSINWNTFFLARQNLGLLAAWHRSHQCPVAEIKQNGISSLKTSTPSPQLEPFDFKFFEDVDFVMIFGHFMLICRLHIPDASRRPPPTPPFVEGLKQP